MKMSLVGFAVLAGLVVGLHPVGGKPVPKTPPKLDAELLQGEWNMVAMEQGGTDVKAMPFKIIVKGDKWHEIYPPKEA